MIFDKLNRWRLCIRSGRPFEGPPGGVLALRALGARCRLLRRLHLPPQPIPAYAKALGRKGDVIAATDIRFLEDFILDVVPRAQGSVTAKQVNAH
jgi:hypothetical protein